MNLGMSFSVSPEVFSPPSWNIDRLDLSPCHLVEACNICRFIIQISDVQVLNQLLHFLILKLITTRKSGLILGGKLSTSRSSNLRVISANSCNKCFSMQCQRIFSYLETYLSVFFKNFDVQIEQI